MTSVSQLLLAAGIRHEPYGRPPVRGVVVTEANQLIGTYADLKRFQLLDRNYHRWQAHHIVEFQDFGRLGVTRTLPSREQQVCVLIPERAHIGRVNSVLTMSNPAGVTVSAKQLRAAYHDAYRLIGNYCGGGDAKIARELTAIVDATFNMVGVPQ